jgi:predicted metal-dependent phosphoesterase TrpH
MRNAVDLHVHTNCSDGLLWPEAVIDFCIKNSIKILSITDHDTVQAYSIVNDYVRDKDIIMVPGVELSTAWHSIDFHILGYFVDLDNGDFQQKIDYFRKQRMKRGEAIVKKLNELGIDISMETVKKVAGNSVMGRPHVADALVKEEYVLTLDEAFARYLGYHAPAYVPKKYLTPQEAIDLIHGAHGVAVWAHPGPVGKDHFLGEFIDMGLDGIEAFHPLHDVRTSRHYMNLAKRHDILYTGGSDCHARRERILIGTQNVPQKCYKMLITKKEKYS